MTTRYDIRSQLWITSGAAVFCIGAVIAYEWWWAKAIFGVLALFAVWLAWVWAYEIWGKK